MSSPPRWKSRFSRSEALSPHYEIHVEKDGNLDCVTVRVELKPDAAGADAASAGQELQHRVKTHIGITTKVEVTVPGTLARSSKAVRLRQPPEIEKPATNEPRAHRVGPARALPRRGPLPKKPPTRRLLWSRQGQLLKKRASP